MDRRRRTDAVAHGVLADALDAAHAALLDAPALPDPAWAAEVVVAALDRNLEPATVAVLVASPGRRLRRWAARGCDLPSVAGLHDLPAPLADRLDDPGAVLDVSLPGGSTARLTPASTTGIYAALQRDGAVIALIAAEHPDPGRYGPGDARRLARELPRLSDVVAAALAYERLAALAGGGAADAASFTAREGAAQDLAHAAWSLDHLAKAHDVDALRTGVENLRRELAGPVSARRRELADLRAPAGLRETVGGLGLTVDLDGLRVRPVVEPLLAALALEAVRAVGAGPPPVGGSAVPDAGPAGGDGEPVISLSADDDGAVLEVRGPATAEGPARGDRARLDRLVAALGGVAEPGPEHVLRILLPSDAFARPS